jgi:hypothetical protein
MALKEKEKQQLFTFTFQQCNLSAINFLTLPLQGRLRGTARSTWKTDLNHLIFYAPTLFIS